MSELSVFTCTDHIGHYLGGVSVVVASDEETARELLKAGLREQGLDPNEPFTLRKISLTEPKAFVLDDGDY